MYLDIEKQLDKITEDLEALLLESKAIDKEGNVIDNKKFNQILNSKIAQCNKILATTEKDGVVQDTFGANVVFNRINRLEQIKQNKSLTPESALPENDIEGTKSIVFKLGISKIFQKIQSKFSKHKSNNNNR